MRARTASRTVGLTVTILLALLTLIAAGVAGAAKSWATGNPHTKVLEWTLPNGGTSTKVTWPQTPYAGECGVWIQVDVYPYKTDTDKARTDALDDDGLLTRGEDHGWVKSWSFRQAPPCTTPTPTPEPTWIPTPTAAPSTTTSPTATPNPSSTPLPEPTSEPTPTVQPTSEPSAPAPMSSMSSSPANTTVASASPTATPGTSEHVELAATGLSGVQGLLIVLLALLLGAFCIGIGISGRRPR